VPFLIHLASVDGGSVAHQQHRAHQAYHQDHLGMVFLYVEGLLPPNSQQVEVVSQPAQDHHGRAGNSGKAEEDELGVVLGAFADPAIGERGLMFVVLRDPVYDEEGGDDDEGAELEED
jgi:hypothetical protein